MVGVVVADGVPVDGVPDGVGVPDDDGVPDGVGDMVGWPGGGL